MLDGSHHGEAEHDERDVTMPAVPGSGFVVVEPELVFGCLEAILDRPAMALDADQGLDRSPCRTPGGEVGEIAVGDITPDQQASCPKDLAVIVELFAFEIGQFEVAPVVQSRSFGSITGRPTPPVRSSLRLCDLLGGAEIAQMPWRESLIHEVEILARVHGPKLLTVDQEVGGSSPPSCTR